jgi:N-acetylglucosamine kinase-like BadF-type ATPase
MNATHSPESPSGSEPGVPLVVGIDAGGTRTRVQLAEARDGGAVLGEGGAGPGNALSTGREALTRHLTEALAAAVAPELRRRVVAVFGGFAGAARDAGQEAGRELARSCLAGALGALGFAPHRASVSGDLEIAFAAAPGTPADGLVLIAGTGAVAARMAGHHRVASVDGAGWLLGDAGSGFWLGRETVRAALAALDGRGPWTSLVEAVTAHYLDHPGGPYLIAERPAEHECELLRERVVRAAYAHPPVTLARLAPLAVHAGDAGDEVAITLLDDAADELAATVTALDPREGEPLIAAGGLLGPTGPLLGRLAARAETLGLDVVPVHDGVAGAVSLARLRLREGEGERAPGRG